MRFIMCNSISTILYTKLFGKYVGHDEFNNKFYESRFGASWLQRTFHRKRRWALYSNKNIGRQDGSMLSNTWFNWLHHRTDIIPENVSSAEIKNFEKSGEQNNNFFWTLLNIPNMTGTKNAYYPPHYNEMRDARWIVKGENDNKACVGDVAHAENQEVLVEGDAGGDNDNDDTTTNVIDGAYQAWKPNNR